MNRMPTEEEFLGWLEHPATKALQRWLFLKREGLRDAWAEGHLAERDVHAWAARNAEAIGVAGLCKEVLRLDYDQLVKELNDGNSEVGKRGTEGTRFALK